MRGIVTINKLRGSKGCLKCSSHFTKRLGLSSSSVKAIHELGRLPCYWFSMVAHPYHSILPHVNWNVCDILLSNETSFLVFHLISSLILSRN